MEEVRFHNGQPLNNTETETTWQNIQLLDICCSRRWTKIQINIEEVPRFACRLVLIFYFMFYRQNYMIYQHSFTLKSYLHMLKYGNMECIIHCYIVIIMLPGMYLCMWSNTLDSCQGKLFVVSTICINDIAVFHN